MWWLPLVRTVYLPVAISKLPSFVHTTLARGAPSLTKFNITSTSWPTVLEETCGDRLCTSRKSMLNSVWSKKYIYRSKKSSHPRIADPLPVGTHAGYSEVFCWSYGTVTELDIIQSYVTLRIHLLEHLNILQLTLGLWVRWILGGWWYSADHETQCNKEWTWLIPDFPAPWWRWTWHRSYGAVLCSLC